MFIDSWNILKKRGLQGKLDCIQQHAPDAVRMVLCVTVSKGGGWCTSVLAEKASGRKSDLTRKGPFAGSTRASTSPQQLARVSKRDARASWAQCVGIVVCSISLAMFSAAAECLHTTHVLVIHHLVRLQLL